MPPDTSFGQGIAAGDVNNDGFDDLYIANIGSNRLLQNNGDGTFSDHTPAEIRLLSEWTTSCAIADLNLDGVSDLFDVTYSQDAEVFTRLCPTGPEQIPRSCRPDIFEGSTDRLFLGDGAGSFAETALGEVIPADAGHGLGLVIGDFLEQGHCEVFISNDMTPNALLVAHQEPGQALRFADEALLRGVAVNGVGRIEACMGIAAGDVTGDGLTELFVTNFLEETNTLYSLKEGGVFQDISMVSGAAEDSLSMLGFGTQFLDADRNGTMDLFLVNGHVDDFSHMGSEWKMKPAVYQNLGQGQFRHLPNEALGAYGSVPQLGRAMAKLDWNRDGREDLVMTHLDRAPALLQNNTMSVGKALTFRLVGTTSTRHPAGAVLRLTVENSGERRQVVSHLTAGDGYYCSNEHVLSFSMLPNDRIKGLQVRWPSGLTDSFEDVAETGDWLAVESCPRLFDLTK